MTEPTTTDARILRSKAASLRAQADLLPDVLGEAYRRRASQLELRAWIDDVQAGVPEELIRPAA